LSRGKMSPKNVDRGTSKHLAGEREERVNWRCWGVKDATEDFTTRARNWISGWVEGKDHAVCWG
jgi:hypothetical protein